MGKLEEVNRIDDDVFLLKVKVTADELRSIGGETSQLFIVPSVQLDKTSDDITTLRKTQKAFRMLVPKEIVEDLAIQEEDRQGLPYKYIDALGQKLLIANLSLLGKVEWRKTLRQKSDKNDNEK